MNERIIQSKVESGEKNEENEIKIKVGADKLLLLLDKIRSDDFIERHSHIFDRYYDDKNYSITKLNRGLRLRQIDDSLPIFEFKSLFFVPDLRPNNPWLIEEQRLEMPLTRNSMHQLQRILQRLQIHTIQDDMTDNLIDLDFALNRVGLNPSIIVDKQRLELISPDVVFAFDQVEGLGQFVELESINEGNPVEIINQYISPKDYEVVREGYNDMLIQRVPEIPTAQERLLKFAENPQWNVLPGEDEIINSILSK